MPHTMKGVFMKKILVFCLLLGLAGCAGVQLTPEMERITSITDPTNCKIIKNMTITTQPHNMIRYLQYNTSVSGGDSYKVIATQSQSLMARNDTITTICEIYKCK
jgi:hypothetical protein